MLLRKARPKLAVGCQLGRELLSFLLHILLNLLEKIISKMRGKPGLSQFQEKVDNHMDKTLTFLLVCPPLSFHQELPRARACFALTTLNKSEQYFLSSQPKLQTSHGYITLVNAMHSPDLRELPSQAQPPTTSICHCSSSEGNRGHRDFASEHKNLRKGTPLYFMLPMTKILSSRTTKAQIFQLSFLYRINFFLSCLGFYLYSNDKSLLSASTTQQSFSAVGPQAGATRG